MFFSPKDPDPIFLNLDPRDLKVPDPRDLKVPDPRDPNSESATLVTRRCKEAAGNAGCFQRGRGKCEEAAWSKRSFKGRIF